jgi:transposase
MTVDGCPVAIEVFEGSSADPLTLSVQIDKLKPRFKLQRVVMVGDRGLLTSARMAIMHLTEQDGSCEWVTRQAGADKMKNVAVAP